MSVINYETSCTFTGIDIKPIKKLMLFDVFAFFIFCVLRLFHPYFSWNSNATLEEKNRNSMVNCKYTLFTFRGLKTFSIYFNSIISLKYIYTHKVMYIPEVQQKTNYTYNLGFLMYRFWEEKKKRKKTEGRICIFNEYIWKWKELKWYIEFTVSFSDYFLGVISLE